MSKFYGPVGFFLSEEDAEHPGKYVETIREEPYYGDVISVVNRNGGGAKVISDITLSNRISILADPFANENFQHIRYVTWNGVKWSVESAEIQYPRILLSLGGVFNDES